MAADALTTCFARSLATIVMVEESKQVFNEDGFQ